MANNKSQNNNNKTINLTVIITLIAVTILTIVSLILVVVKPFGVGVQSGDYFGYDARVVYSKPVSEFEEALTPSEVRGTLDDLGFEDYQLTMYYSMTGEYLGEDINQDSNDEHPTYDLQYVTDSGDLWIIYVYGNQIMANPVSYNIQSSRDVRVLISEKESITSYSSKENCFYEIIPNDTEVLVFTVEKIDAKTLEELTPEALDEL